MIMVRVGEHEETAKKISQLKREFNSFEDLIEKSRTFKMKLDILENMIKCFRFRNISGLQAILETLEEVNKQKFSDGQEQNDFHKFELETRVSMSKFITNNTLTTKNNGRIAQLTYSLQASPVCVVDSLLRTKETPRETTVVETTVSDIDKLLRSMKDQ